MIPRREKRSFDERAETRQGGGAGSAGAAETRQAAVSSTAVLEFRGRKHVVRLINVSSSGAMVIFPHIPNIGERMPLQVLDRGGVTAQVRWVRDGRIGLSFAAPLE